MSEVPLYRPMLRGLRSCKRPDAVAVRPQTSYRGTLFMVKRPHLGPYSYAQGPMEALGGACCLL